MKVCVCFVARCPFFRGAKRPKLALVLFVSGQYLQLLLYFSPLRPRDCARMRAWTATRWTDPNQGGRILVLVWASWAGEYFLVCIRQWMNRNGGGKIDLPNTNVKDAPRMHALLERSHVRLW